MLLVPRGPSPRRRDPRRRHRRWWPPRPWNSFDVSYEARHIRGRRPKPQSRQPRRRGSPSACRLLRARSCTRPSSRARIGHPRRSASGKSRSQTCPTEQGAAGAGADAGAIAVLWRRPGRGFDASARSTARDMSCRAAQAPAPARAARPRCASPLGRGLNRRSRQPPRPHFRPWPPPGCFPSKQMASALMPQAARPSSRAVSDFSAPPLRTAPVVQGTGGQHQ